MAPLKQPTGAADVGTDPGHFHGSTAMAPLKRDLPAFERARQSPHFHGSTAVAPLKPDCIESLQRKLNDFHGSTAVAPLKRISGRLVNPLRLRFPRLNSRGPQPLTGHHISSVLDDRRKALCERMLRRAAASRCPQW